MTRGSEFLLDAPADLQDYLREIAARMVLTFDIPRAEAVARINRHWRGQTFDERNDLVLHAPPGPRGIPVAFWRVGCAAVTCGNVAARSGTEAAGMSGPMLRAGRRSW